MGPDIVREQIQTPEQKWMKRLFPYLIVAIPVIMICVFSVSVLYYGTPEFRVDKTQNGLRISDIRRPLNPVEKEDIIIRINGISYDRILSFLYSGERLPSFPHSVTLVREGRLIEFTPRLNPVSLSRFFSTAWPHLLLMFLLISLGILSYWRVTSDQPAALFLISVCFFATTFSATFPSYFGILDPFTISLSFFTLAVSNWVAFGACLHFVFSFPRSRDMIQDRRWLVPVFYLTAPLISICGAMILSENPGEFWGWLQRLRNIGLPGMIWIAFSKHVIDYRKLSSSLEKNQVKLIASAYWLSFGPYLILYAVPNILFNDPFISFRFVVISGAILPGAYFIAMVRYRLLDVDRLISRTVSYFLLVGLLLISYSYLMIFLKRIFIGRQLLSEELFLAYVFVIAVLFEPMNRMITMLLDKLFLPKALYRHRMMPDLSRRIGTTLDLDALIHLLTRILPRELHIRHLKIAISEKTLSRFSVRHPNLEAALRESRYLENQFGKKRDYLFSNSFSADPRVKKELDDLASEGTELILALKGGAGLSGMLLLGNREDGKAYTRRDVEFFTTLANQAALALENALHHESLLESKQQIENMFKKVVQSEKMAALGEMATVLAHELKNPLGIIRSSAQFLTGPEKNPETREELLTYIIGEVDGLETVINNIMGLARYKAPQFSRIDLASETKDMVERWIGSGNHNRQVAIHLDVQQNLPPITADFKQLQQVFLNCITNAEDAMPGGGEITFHIISPDSNTIVIRISDTGPGIPEENLDNAFKKFFTTKEKGMGIGLSVCRQIIQAHNGHISIENRRTNGLNVHIRLLCDPLSAEMVSQNPGLMNKEISLA